ncbi:MAG: hypothetical protein U9O56_08895 [Campylobacterota bacterium]|nr:hypothetical protein [Campylobacterota bacterium]
MHTVTLNIQDNIYSHIMFLLKNLNHKDLEIIEEKRVLDDDTKYNDWNKVELENIGKIGFNSKSFVEDNEDYSKW